jgi:polyisoprenoid-binding protein YceI
MNTLKSRDTARMIRVFLPLLVTALVIGLGAASCRADEPTPTLVPVVPTATPVVSTSEAIDRDESSMMKDQSSAMSDATGKYAVGPGSQGLFKVDETLRGADVVVALSTETLTGSVDFGTNRASVEIDLSTLTSDQARRDRYVRERMFPSQPIATVRFADLGDLPEDFFEGGVVHETTLTGTVNVNGSDTDLPFNITARFDIGDGLAILGKSKFVWSDFGMVAPESNFYTVEDEVTVEVVLQATP